MAEQDAEEIRRILHEWVKELAAGLDAAEAPVDIDQILGLAGVAAHTVIRPAAPLTTYLLGYVAGRAASDSPAAIDDAIATVRRLAAQRGSSQLE
ncbi:DUF6457 domain-containing protein [Salinibacterium sp. G-O1]|uniref:DUF6457 domain-containing protein n=1 Tax=Salinibacterium sp. G-O1 TaxID=3046208 RepID=UPI0024BB8F8C|nr:DUF6457 domain-containing protein [Salinibacterium sp. G-O1]MDJ0335174.1 DUF6457 domain-containing protein [Salinibacterium sp. G-O1]